MRRVRITFVAVACLLAACTATARASRGISVSPTSTSVTFSGFAIEGGTGTPTRCEATVHITLHASIAKTTGTLGGFADVHLGTGACRNGNAGLLVGGRRVTGAQGPFHVTYQSFVGTLPSIISLALKLNDITFWQEDGAFACLTQDAVDLTGSTTGGNPATGISFSAQNIPLAGSLLCSFASGTITASERFTSSLGMSLL